MSELYFETSYSSLNKHGEELCGDKVELIKADGDTIMVLADGLGSGVKANILASLTSKIVSSMISMGADVQDIIETMASTLPVCKERHVAYSTFTFVRLSPSGNAHIVEFDNPDTVLLRNGKCFDLVRTQTTIQGKLIRESQVILEPGDACVIFSDGVIHAGVGKLLNLGWQQKNVEEYLENNFRTSLSAQSVQELLLEACDSLYMGEPGDDTTVAVCRVRTPNTCFVMVGPPVDPRDDVRLVNELMNFDGTKVVCGGTTSQIVSAITHRQLKTRIDYISPDVPPIGEIDGIDLVTEGIVTLGHTLNLLLRYENGGAGRENSLTSKKDGAHLLAAMLILRCTGAKFVVGRALNPAHQNPGLPISLGIKLKLVDDMAACLKRLGKDVEVEYH